MNTRTLDSYPFICFDFDGVIKDSVNAKGQIFVELFATHPSNLKNRIMSHHLSNGGVNRVHKLTQYLQWAFPDTPQNLLPIDTYMHRFSKYAIDMVIRSNWIAGMPDLLLDLSLNSRLFIASASPHGEIQSIVSMLNINALFDSVWGYPHSKSFVLNHIKTKYSADFSTLIMVGDSSQDFFAAQNANVSFFLKTPHNSFPI